MNDHLFCLSQTIMESFSRGEHVIVAFLDVEETFDNVWHNGLRYKIYQLYLPTKLCKWLPDFLVGRVIQVKVEGFLSPKVFPNADVPQGSKLSPLLFLIYVNDIPNPSHHQTSKSQFADDTGQWAMSKSIDLAAKYLQKDLDNMARWCAKCRIELNPEKNKVINILQVYKCNQGRACFIFMWRPSFVLSSQNFPRYHFRQWDAFCKTLRGHFIPLHPKISLFKDIGQQKVGTKPHNHFKDLQTACETNIRIWDCFYNNSFGHCLQQTL